MQALVGIELFVLLYALAWLVLLFLGTKKATKVWLKYWFIASVICLILVIYGHVKARNKMEHVLLAIGFVVFIGASAWLMYILGAGKPNTLSKRIVSQFVKVKYEKVSQFVRVIYKKIYTTKRPIWLLGIVIFGV